MKMRRMLRSILLFPLAIFMGVDGDPGGGTDGSDSGGSSNTDDGGGASGDQGTDDQGGDDAGGGLDPESPEGKAKAAADATLAESAKLFTAPESYEALTVPEGAVVPDGFFDTFNPIAKEFNLSQAGAQKLFDRLAGDLQPKMMADAQAKFEQTKETWLNETKADKELGGTAFEANVKIAGRALNSFGGEGLKDVLDKTGIGNHPEMVRLMFRIGKAMREDQIIHPDAKVGNSESERLDRYYPNR